MENLRLEMCEQALEVHPGLATPELLWLKVHGRPRVDDFGLDEHGRLVVSAHAMTILGQYRLESCRFYDGEQPPTLQQVMQDLWDSAKRSPH